MELETDYNFLLDFWFGKDKKYGYNTCLWFNGICPENKLLRTVEDTDLYIKQHWENILNSYPTDKYIDLFKDEHKLKPWLETCDGKMALMILFDQFPSHIYKQNVKSYAFENYALCLSRDIITNHIQMLDVLYKICVYMTLTHSEDESLITEATLNILKIADSETDSNMKKHFIKLAGISQERLNIVKKFGRYPHKNDLMKRISTTDEIDFLSSKKIPTWMKVPTTKLPKKTRLISNEVNKSTKDNVQKLEILVLHGNHQSAKIFKNKTEKDLEKKLKKIANLTYCDSPRLYHEGMSDLNDSSSTNEHYSSTKDDLIREWWNTKEESETIIYEGLEKSLEYINSLFKYNHYDGIIGFSQGSALVGIISAFVNDFKNGKIISVQVNNIAE